MLGRTVSPDWTDASTPKLREFIRENYEVGKRYDGRPVAIARERPTSTFMLDEANGRALWQHDLLSVMRWCRDVEIPFDKLETLVRDQIDYQRQAATDGTHVITWALDGWRAAVDLASTRGWRRTDAVEEYVRQSMRDELGELVTVEKTNRALDEVAKTFDWTDLAEGWEDDPPRPDCLARTDGSCAFYLGQRNLVIGHTESGKTWLMAMAAKQEVDAGRQVVIFDHENGPAIVTDRLRALGLTREQVRTYVRYAHLSAPLPPTMARELAEKLAAEGARLMISDALTPVAHAMGLDTSGGDTNAVEQVFTVVLDPWVGVGFAAVILDNTPKSNRYGSLGSQHKTAGVGGAVLAVVADTPFSRGRAGASKIYLIKDRGGNARYVMDEDRRWWGVLHVAPEPVSDGVVAYVEAPPEPEVTAATAVVTAFEIINQTADLAASALRKHGVTECRSMRKLAGWMQTVRETEPALYAAAHTDRDHITDCLTKVAEPSVLDLAGIGVEVIATPKSVRYRVWLLRPTPGGLAETS